MHPALLFYFAFASAFMALSLLLCQVKGKEAPYQEEVSLSSRMRSFGTDRLPVRQDLRLRSLALDGATRAGCCN